MLLSVIAARYCSIWLTFLLSFLNIPQLATCMLMVYSPLFMALSAQLLLLSH